MSTSVPLLAVLDHLLAQEVDAYESLLRLHQEAYEHLTASALEPLQANLQAREHLVLHLTRLEQQRAAVLAQLGPLFPWLPLPLCLADLSRHVAEPYQRSFLRYRAQLRQLTEALHQSTVRQMPLLVEAQALIDAALAFLARFLPLQSTYKPSGQLMTPTQGRLLSGRA